MVRKIQDYYFNKAKKEKYPARSVYKLEEAQKKYRLIRRGDAVLDLGCYPGSWSLYAAEIAGSTGMVIGVDLQEMQTVKQSGKAPILTHCCDITSDDFEQILVEFGKKFQVVLSDMAPQTTGNKWTDQQRSLELARMALAVALRKLAPKGNFYCKVFEGEDFKEYVDSVKKHFTMIKIVKPQSSRKESREVFVLGMGFNGEDENYSTKEENFC